MGPEDAVRHSVRSRRKHRKVGLEYVGSIQGIEVFSDPRIDSGTAYFVDPDLIWYGGKSAKALFKEAKRRKQRAALWTFAVSLVALGLAVIAAYYAWEVLVQWPTQ